MEINLIREQSITVRTRLPSTSAQATFRGNASLLRAGGAGQTRCGRGRPGVGGTGRPGVGGDGAGQTRAGGPEGARWVGQACTAASLPLRGRSVPPFPRDSSCRGWAAMCLDRSGAPDRGGGPGSGRHLLLHQKQAVSCHQCGSRAPPAGLELGGAPGPVQSARTRSTSVLNSGCPARGQNGDWGFTPSVLLAGHPHAVSHLQTGALQPCTQESGGPVTESQLHPLVGGLLKSPGLDFVK